MNPHIGRPVLVPRTPVPDSAELQRDGVRFGWSRRAAERSYIGDFVPWVSVREIDLTWPPELHLHDGRTAFLPDAVREELAVAADAVGVPIASRSPVWSFLLAPFLDTDYNIVRDHFEASLRELGFSARETKWIRRRVAVRMALETVMSWEWADYSHHNLVEAWGLFKIPPLLTTPWRYRRFRRWTDRIAERGVPKPRPQERRVGDSNLDLDYVAGHVKYRQEKWGAAGIEVAPLTWTDHEASWPHPLETERDKVRRPRSVRVALRVGEADGEILFWAGGWADIDYRDVRADEVVSRHVTIDTLGEIEMHIDYVIAALGSHPPALEGS